MTFPVIGMAIVAGWVVLRYARRKPTHLIFQSDWLETPIHRQHWQLYQGGKLNRYALESAKQQWKAKLQREDPEQLVAQLQPGTDYLIQVHALAELGSQSAVKVLEKQLQRTISTDPVEQSWYWIDVARSLRYLHHTEALPALLRRNTQILPLPMGHLYAAEMIAFPSIGNYLNYPLSWLGQATLKVILTTLRGLRNHLLPTSLIADVQLGEMLDRLVRNCPGTADPLVSMVFLEMLRMQRRSFDLAVQLEESALREQSIRMQLQRFAEAEPIIREYLHGIEEDLARMLPMAAPEDQEQILEALFELRADVGIHLLPLLNLEHFSNRAMAFRCLRWSQHPTIRNHLLQHFHRRSSQGNRSWWMRRSGPENSLQNRWYLERTAILEALAHHPSPESEKLLIAMASRSDPCQQIKAIQSLGWCEPVCRSDVISLLQSARMSKHAEVRLAATIALGRLGEVSALQEFREILHSGDSSRIHEALDWIADGGLTWLWAEVDELVDGTERTVAIHACDVLERLREQFIGPMN